MLQENLVTFSQASAILPRIGGKRPHVSTIWRWARKGCRGVKLETVRLGGRFLTSIEALERFGKALAEQPLNDNPPPKPPPTRTNKQRERSIARAERELAVAGIL